MSKKIMVIEDNVMLLELYRAMLTEEGYQVHMYSTKTQKTDFLATIKEVAPDLIIIDLMLGRNENGWSWIQKIREDAATSNISLILCSGNSRRVKELENELKALAVKIILKPFKVEEFLNLIAASLN